MCGPSHSGVTKACTRRPGAAASVELAGATRARQAMPSSAAHSLLEAVAYHVHTKHASFVFQFHCWFLPSHVPPPLSLGYTLTTQATTNKLENKNSMPDEAKSLPPIATNNERNKGWRSRKRGTQGEAGQTRPMSACTLSSKRVFSSYAHERRHTLKALVCRTRHACATRQLFSRTLLFDAIRRKHTLRT